MPDPKQCRTCKFWKPKYHGVGNCEREGRANAKFWVTEGRELLTIAAFSCCEYDALGDLSAEVI